jgi:hypothetical protein
MIFGMIEGFPELPEEWDSASLATADEAGLADAARSLSELERLMLAALAPYNQQVKELKARQAEVATEVRRRERAARHAKRKEVQQAARSEAMPTLVAALSDSEGLFDADRTFTSIPAFLATGGAVGFGFATKAGNVAFSNGRGMEYAATFGRARELWSQGWELGTPQVPGVRVHLAGTLVERVVSGDDVVVKND